MYSQKFRGCGFGCYKCSTVVTKALAVAVLMAAVVVLSLYIGVGGSHQRQTFYLVPGDTVRYDYSPFTCSRIALESNELSGLCHFEFKEKPHLVHNGLLSFNDTFDLKTDEHKSWSFYLHNESIIAVSACAQIIKGCSNKQPEVDIYLVHCAAYTKWENHHLSCKGPGDYDVCVHKSITPARDCHSASTMTHNTLTINLTDVKYFIVFHNSHCATVNVSISISINRTVYDICKQRQQNQCTGPKQTSELDITFGQKLKIPAVIYVEDKYVTWDKEYDAVTVLCEPQWVFYIIVTITTVTLFTIIALFLLICDLKRCIRPCIRCIHLSRRLGDRENHDNDNRYERLRLESQGSRGDEPERPFDLHTPLLQTGQYHGSGHHLHIIAHGDTNM